MIKKLFDKLFLAKQKFYLQKEKKRLENELRKIKKFPNFGSSEEDHAQEMGVFEENRGMQAGLLDLQKQVDRAMTKIEKNEYGTCDKCKQSIEIGRLKAFPAANTCVTCASKK